MLHEIFGGLTGQGYWAGDIGIGQETVLYDQSSQYICGAHSHYFLKDYFVAVNALFQALEGLGISCTFATVCVCFLTSILYTDVQTKCTRR